MVLKKLEFEYLELDTPEPKEGEVLVKAVIM